MGTWNKSEEVPSADEREREEVAKIVEEAAWGYVPLEEVTRGGMKAGLGSGQRRSVCMQARLALRGGSHG